MSRHLLRHSRVKQKHPHAFQNPSAPSLPPPLRPSTSLSLGTMASAHQAPMGSDRCLPTPPPPAWPAPRRPAHPDFTFSVLTRTRGLCCGDSGSKQGPEQPLPTSRASSGKFQGAWKKGCTGRWDPRAQPQRQGHWIPPLPTGSSAGQHPPQPGTQGPRQGKATAGPGPALGCLAWRKSQASHIKTSWPPTISGVSVPVTGSLSSLWGLWSPSPSPIFLDAL